MQVIELEYEAICCTGSCDNRTDIKLSGSMPICKDHIEAMQERFK